MSRFLNEAREIGGNVARILQSRDAAPLLRDYARLKASQLREPRGNGRPRTQRILGTEVAFYDPSSLLLLFEEIFVREDYSFRAPTRSPFIVDAGSNIGLATLYFKRRYPGARVLAFEPDPAAFALLERNVGRLPGVDLRREALHREAGSAVMRSGSTASPAAAVSPDGAGEEVPVVRLSDRLDGPVDLLKMDVEGAEGAIMEDLEESGKLDLVRESILEYHHPADGGSALARFLERLERAGFDYRFREVAPPSTVDVTDQTLLIWAYRRP